MVDQMLNRVVIRRVCLNDDSSRLIASAGPSCDLAQQLKLLMRLLVRRRSSVRFGGLADFCHRGIERYAACWVLRIVKNRHSHSLVEGARRVVALASDKLSTSESKAVLDGLNVSSIILSGYIG